MIDASTKIIALCGKGGVGKTSISALTTKILTEKDNSRVLAIDADPALGLSIALDMKVDKTVNDIRNQLISELKSGTKLDKQTMLSRMDYELFQAMAEKQNFAFLAIGRPESEGCYCQINNFLKDMIKEISSNFDYIIIDGEAGIEQVNRRVMEKVTHLLLVSDTSIKGAQIVQSISEVADNTLGPHEKGVLFNRLKHGEEIDKHLQGKQLRVLGKLYEDEGIYSFDRSGESLLDMPEGDNLRSLENALAEFELI
ncbi:MAG: AAA family ATPase [Thermodesulfobacteriota bacterium]